MNDRPTHARARTHMTNENDASNIKPARVGSEMYQNTEFEHEQGRGREQLVAIGVNGR